MLNLRSQAWIISAPFDLCFILLPPVFITILVLVFAKPLAALNDIPFGLWFILIVGIDAGHVYTTLFRTYLVRDELIQRHALLTLTPILAWLIGCLLYSIDSLLFWRTLAYLALFHFIRQQYGFMMLYGRNEQKSPKSYRQLDRMVIYLATFYPIIYWHCHSRSFNWFVENDFVIFNAGYLSEVAGLLYCSVLAAYMLKESRLWHCHKTINIPRNLVLLGTGLSWYVGIVTFDNDFIFTLTNIIAHGIPYYALIWAYGYKRNNFPDASAVYVTPYINLLFNRCTAIVYVAIMMLFAYFEESLWDGLVWHEHSGYVNFFSAAPIQPSTQTLTWLVPLLAVPQTTHYLLDAFIWRLNQPDTLWKKVLFPKHVS